MDSNPFQILAVRRHKRDAERQRLNERLEELADEGRQDEIVKRWLESQYPDGFPVDGQLALPDPKSTEASNLNRSVITAQHHSSVPVKDMLLVIVREAGPEGVSAEQIRARAQIKFGVDVNPNTLTVSLVRHRKDGKVKCDKKRWFYVNPFNFSAFTASLNHSANGSTEKSKSPED